jgi:glutathione S-transferase
MPTLITIPFSHFCEKARWALDVAGVAFREEAHVPGLHRFAVKRARGKPGSVPVLVVEGAGVIDDSPLIVRWADAQAPEHRKLLPAQGSARYSEALALERELDVELGPHSRRLAYFHMLPQRRQFLHQMGIATPPLEHAVVRATFPLLRRLIRRALRIDEAGASRSRDSVRRVFDKVGQRLADGRPHLLGDTFGAADIAFAALASPILAPPEHPLRAGRALAPPPPGLADEIRAFRETPAGSYALRLYRERRKFAGQAGAGTGADASQR